MVKKAEQDRRKFCIATLIAVVTYILGFLGFFLHVLAKVRSGYGLDYYNTFWGVQFNYIGALTVIIVGAVVMALAPIIYWFASMEERSFKKKYEIHDGKA